MQVLLYDFSIQLLDLDHDFEAERFENFDDFEEVSHHDEYILDDFAASDHPHLPQGSAS